MESRNSSASCSIQPPASFAKDRAGAKGLRFSPALVISVNISRITLFNDLPLALALLRISFSSSGSRFRRVICPMSYPLRFFDSFSNHLLVGQDEGQKDHEIRFSPLTGIRFVVDSSIKSRHTANAVLKQAGLPKRF
jgi:hypothetical protein